MEITLKGVAVKATEITGIVVVLGFIGSLWIDREVERRMLELVEDPAESSVVVTLVANAETTEATLIRIEGKVDAFSGKFLDYLERQAN